MMDIRNEVTIYDIAKALKLSTSTISRALNGSGPVNEETRMKVERVADELGYRRNFHSSRLRSNKSRLLGAMVTQLNSSMASCLLSGVEMTSSTLGYSLIVTQTLNKPELRETNVQNLKNHRVDGLLITSAYFQEYESLNQVTALNVPLIVVEASSFLPGCPRKKIGDFQNAYELTNHLIEKGCRRIAYLSVDLNRTRHANLLSGYREALLHSKLPEADRFVLNNYDAEKSWAEICDVLVSITPRPDGIIFSNNTITAIAFATSNETSSTNTEYWLTCRKGSLASQNLLLIELGKIATALLICLCENSPSKSSDLKSTTVISE
jgi:LacI family transcriptional regulator